MCLPENKNNYKRQPLQHEGNHDDDIITYSLLLLLF